MAKPVHKKEIIRKIARELGLSIGEVEEAVDSQFHFVASVMKSDTFDQIRLPFFGRFWVKAQRLKHLQKFGKRMPEDTDEAE